MDPFSIGTAVLGLGIVGVLLVVFLGLLIIAIAWALIEDFGPVGIMPMFAVAMFIVAAVLRS